MSKEIRKYLQLYAFGATAMSRWRPKAARKRRIQKKWANRFGPGSFYFNWQDAFLSHSPGIGEEE